MLNPAEIRQQLAFKHLQSSKEKYEKLAIKIKKNLLEQQKIDEVLKENPFHIKAVEELVTKVLSSSYNPYPSESKLLVVFELTPRMLEENGIEIKEDNFNYILNLITKYLRDHHHTVEVQDHTVRISISLHIDLESSNRFETLNRQTRKILEEASRIEYRSLRLLTSYNQ